MWSNLIMKFGKRRNKFLCCGPPNFWGVVVYWLCFCINYIFKWLIFPFFLFLEPRNISTKETRLVWFLTFLESSYLLIHPAKTPVFLYVLFLFFFWYRSIKHIVLLSLENHSKPWYLSFKKRKNVFDWYIEIIPHNSFVAISINDQQHF